MRFLSFTTLAFTLGLSPAFAQGADAVAPPKGFTAIFNGKDLAGWHGWAIHGKGGSPADMAKADDATKKKMIADWTVDSQKHWSVKDAELINDGNGAYLATEKEYGDYELLIDYRTVPKADSGIYLKNGPQVQIWDYTDKGKFAIGGDKGSGGLWNNSPGAAGKDPLVLADKPLGEWNSFRIIQLGERTTIYLNGKLVVDHSRMENYWNRKGTLPAKGKILLQTHGGEIRWRNIFLREIPAEEANAMLAKKNDTGFVSIFNGKDLTGWDGDAVNYEVVEGAIMCKKGKGGNLFTKEVYADFVATAEYKLPPGGNNGFAIRYPGKGQPSTVGMTELQVLDDTAEKYAKLDPRQFNGSAYGMAAATKGYLRPVGEWNYQVMTVKGSTIKVELNGTLILDTDLSKITEFKDKAAHPGKDLKSGHFGFAGHGDAVAFRNLKIQVLK